MVLCFHDEFTCCCDDTYMIALLYISGVDLGDLATLKKLLMNKYCYVLDMSSCVAGIEHI